MEEQSQTDQAEGGSTPLSVVYPGESVTLSDGRVVWVSPWGVKALVKEIPTKFGSFVGKLAPMADVLRGADVTEVVPMVMSQAADELLELAAWTSGMTTQELEDRPASDLLVLFRAILRQNQAFFEQLAGLLADVTREIGTRGSRSRSR